MIKIKKLIVLALVGCLFTSCSASKSDVKDRASQSEISEAKAVTRGINVSVSTFASSTILDYMSKGEDQAYEVKFEDDLGKLMEGKFDIAVVPAIMAPAIYNATNSGVNICAISLLNNLYTMSDTEINSAKDLFGKTLLLKDMGASLDKAIESKLSILKNLLGMDIAFYKDSNDLSDMILEKKSFLAILPEPYLYKINRDRKYIAYDFSETLPFLSLDKQGLENDLISEVVLVNKKFAKDNNNALNKFLDDYKNATEKIQNNPQMSASLINKYGLNSKEIEEIYRSLNIVYIDGDTMKGMFNIYMDTLEKIKLNFYQGERPGDDFYYVK